MAGVDFNKMLVRDFFIRQQQLIDQGLEEEDMLMGNCIIGYRLQEIKDEYEINEAVLDDFSAGFFIRFTKFDESDLPLKLFLPPNSNDYQLNESPLLNLQQIEQESNDCREDVIVYMSTISHLDMNLEETTTKEDDQVGNEDLILTTNITVDEGIAIKRSLDSIDSLKIDFVIGSEEEVDVYVVEFEMNGKITSDFEQGTIKIWSKSVIGCKGNFSKYSRLSKALFRVP